MNLNELGYGMTFQVHPGLFRLILVHLESFIAMGRR